MQLKVLFMSKAKLPASLAAKIYKLACGLIEWLVLPCKIILLILVLCVVILAADVFIWKQTRTVELPNGYALVRQIFITPGTIRIIDRKNQNKVVVPAAVGEVGWCHDVIYGTWRDPHVRSDLAPHGSINPMLHATFIYHRRHQTLEKYNDTVTYTEPDTKITRGIRYASQDKNKTTLKELLGQLEVPLTNMNYRTDFTDYLYGDTLSADDKKNPCPQ